MKRKINVGIVGFGQGGKVFHAPIIQGIEGLSLTKIVARKQETIEDIKKIYPSVETVSDIDSLLQDEELELVVIATPNITHTEFAKKALLANKHVVVEKPFTNTSKEAEELIELAEKQNKILTVNQNRRWDSDFLTVKKIIENNFLGNIVEYEAHFDRFRNVVNKDDWKEESLPGAGILYNLGSHLIDQALCLFGIPKEITAHVGIQREEAKVEDFFHVILHYEKHKAVLRAGMLVREALPHFIVLGDKGSFVKYGMDPQEEALKAGELPYNNELWGTESEEIWGILNTEVSDSHFRGKVESNKGDYRELYRNVYKAIIGEEVLQVKPQEARDTIKIIELALKSNKEKRTIPFL
ncbi:Predicted dehydrogenase [Natronincola peptidivorans]|uniref:Predicted dehydrogenase n=1 Tax=Natronincola peptidivorans TaxID=426128 RepID=A0A1I0D666_9FIRM|nr:oxidoreductase [Natronincola peptidivorans]SET27706.1 Predicted dehydrogenase [Natronincola peptidivorans]